MGTIKQMQGRLKFFVGRKRDCRMFVCALIYAGTLQADLVSSSININIYDLLSNLNKLAILNALITSFFSIHPLLAV